MLLKRIFFFLILFAIVVIPVISARIVWICSAKSAVGRVAFQGMDIAGQMQRHYSVIMFSSTGRDTVFFNTGDNELYIKDQQLPILFQPDNPADARLDTFFGLWMDSVMYGGIFLLLILIIFLHPAIIPYGARICLQKKRPFIKLV